MTKNKIITAVIIAVLIMAAGAYKLYLQSEDAKILTGTVEATKADITPRQGGYLRERPFKEGDRVEAGQAAAQLDVRDLEAQLAECDAALKKAQSQLIDLEKAPARRNCVKQQQMWRRPFLYISSRMQTACVMKNFTAREQWRASSWTRPWLMI